MRAGAFAVLTLPRQLHLLQCFVQKRVSALCQLMKQQAITRGVVGQGGPKGRVGVPVRVGVAGRGLQRNSVRPAGPVPHCCAHKWRAQAACSAHPFPAELLSSLHSIGSKHHQFHRRPTMTASTGHACTLQVASVTVAWCQGISLLFGMLVQRTLDESLIVMVAQQLEMKRSSRPVQPASRCLEQTHTCLATNSVDSLHT